MGFFIDGAEFARKIAALEAARDPDPLRPILAGFMVRVGVVPGIGENVSDAPWEMELATADGFQLAATSIPVQRDDDESTFGTVVDGEQLALVAKMVRKAAGVRFESFLPDGNANRSLRLKWATGMFEVPALHGNFPDYRKLLPEPGDVKHLFAIDGSRLKAALAPCRKTGHDSIVRIGWAEPDKGNASPLYFEVHGVRHVIMPMVTRADEEAAEAIAGHKRIEAAEQAIEAETATRVAEGG